MLVEVRGAEAEAAMRRGFRRSWTVFTFSLVAGISANLHWMAGPPILALVTGEKMRIVDAWPPVNDSWKDFALSYFAQAPSVLSIGQSFYLFDNIFFCLAESILSHLEVLHLRLRAVDLTEGSSEELVACLRYHDKILRTCGLLRDASTSTILFQCTNTVVMSCSGVFVMAMSDELEVNVVLQLLEMLLIITVVLYSYCWYSNQITYQCSNLVRSAYMSQWTASPVSDQRTLLIMMTRTMKPVLFGGILEIDLNTFITVLKSIFSYYNFLMAVAKSTAKD